MSLRLTAHSEPTTIRDALAVLDEVRKDLASEAVLYIEGASTKQKLRLAVDAFNKARRVVLGWPTTDR